MLKPINTLQQKQRPSIKIAGYNETSNATGRVHRIDNLHHLTDQPEGKGIILLFTLLILAFIVGLIATLYIVKY
jgi:hypothetical protein